MEDDDIQLDEEIDDDDVNEEGNDNSNMLDIEENDDVWEKPPMHREHSFQVVEYSSLETEAQKKIDSVVDILSTTPSTSQILLRSYKWDKEKLIEKYSENPDKVLKEAGISKILETPPKDSRAKVTCEICLDILPAKNTYALGCGHRFCFDCWTGYLENKLSEGRDCVSTKCPAEKCNEIVHEQAFRKFLKEDKMKIYKKYIVKSFVEDNPQIKWCPAAGCNRAVSYRKNAKKVVHCVCGFKFCFNCSDAEIGDHIPATCDQVESWRQKASDESENVTWLLANTKKCPQCRSPIEKNGGCMHMTCRVNSGGCGFEFCWLCRGPWTEHGSHTGGYYSCNKYDKSDAKKEDDKAADVKTELEKYMFYYHRYESHRNAMKIADDQRKAAYKKAIDLQEKFDVRLEDTKFLTFATEQLIENRHVLQFSYVYGFYMEKGKEKDLFEYLQENLEKHTNHLSDIYETPLEKITSYQDAIKWKSDVTNYTRVIKKFLDNFMNDMQENNLITSA